MKNINFRNNEAYKLLIANIQFSGSDIIQASLPVRHKYYSCGCH